LVRKPVCTLKKWKETLGKVELFTDEEKGPYMVVTTPRGECGWMAVTVDAKGELDFRSYKMPPSSFD
jgi:hypothetical protein